MNSTHALIIDDNIRNIHVLSNLLNDENITNTHITNPKQLDAILQDDFDVNIIFLDLEMPDMDGYEVYQLLRSNPRFNGVPIVACTVHISEIHTASQVGFDSFLGKPLNPDNFPQQVSRILQGKGVWVTS
jgi:two-component system cell cycle response regulator DivK